MLITTNKSSDKTCEACGLNGEAIKVSSQTDAQKYHGLHSFVMWACDRCLSNPLKEVINAPPQRESQQDLIVRLMDEYKEMGDSCVSAKEVLNDILKIIEAGE